MLYFAFIHSQMAYGIEVYGNTFSSYLNKLIILNNKILRILQNAPRETHVADLYITFNTLTLPNLHKFHILLFMHKFFHHNELLPNIFSSYFTKNSDLHTYNTRSKNEPHFQLFTTSLGQRSIKFKGCQLWCSLPDELRSVSSTSVFKTKLKQFLQTL